MGFVEDKAVIWDSERGIVSVNGYLNMDRLIGVGLLSPLDSFQMGEAVSASFFFLNHHLFTLSKKMRNCSIKKKKRKKEIVM